MATPPDFSVGQVLTAAHMDAVGLWKVDSGTLSGATTNFEGCFTDDFTNYLITIDQVQVSGSANIYLKLMNGSSVTTGNDYFWATVRLNQSNVASNTASATQPLGFTGFGHDGANNVPIGLIKLDVFAPKVAVRTLIKTASVAYGGSETQTADGAVRHNLVNAYDGIQFLTNTAVTMGGNVTIYGYRP